MLFVTAEDFFAQAKKMSRLSREEERRLAQEMKYDPAAREQLICSYWPTVAAVIGRAPRKLHSLKTVYVCLASLEKGVDQFDFQQSKEPFSHHLCRRLRQCITQCIADQG